MLEQKALGPDAAQRGERGEADDLPGLQVRTQAVHLRPALLHIQQQHLPVHVQGTLEAQRQAGGGSLRHV